MKILILKGDDDKISELQQRFKYHTTLERFDTDLFIHFAVKDREIVRVKINDQVIASSTVPDLYLYSVTDLATLKLKLASNSVFVVAQVTNDISVSCTFDLLHHLIN